MSRRDDERVWKALADPTRRTILDLLRKGPRSTGDLCEAFPTSRFAVMKHLGVLEDAGLIVVRRRGRVRWNAINAVPLRRLYDRWVSAWSDRTAASLLQLQSVAEATREGPSMRVRAIVIEEDVVIDASPAHVWKTLTQDTDTWWLHNFWDGGTAFMELRVGGAVGERSGEKQVLAAVVTRIEPFERLQMRGPMGMDGAVAGVIDYRLEPHQGGTLLKLSHHVVGDVDEETEASYTNGWRTLLHDGLKPCCEGREIVRSA